MHLIAKDRLDGWQRATAPNKSASSNARSDLPADRYGQATSLLHALARLFAIEPYLTVRGALLEIVKEKGELYSLLLTELDLLWLTTVEFSPVR
jgi:hypothetical protein